jgi:hypothetical protein
MSTLGLTLRGAVFIQRLDGRCGDIHRSSARQGEGSGGLKQQRGAAEIAAENIKEIE